MECQNVNECKITGIDSGEERRIKKVKKIFAGLVALLPSLAFAEGVTDASTFAAELANNATSITTALWAAAGAFIVVMVAYIAIKAVLRGAKSVS